jgi:serine/threonine-protein kinase HipA
MRKLEVRLDWGDEEILVGTLAEQERGLYFEYDAGFLRAPLLISPFKLPPRPGLFEHTDRDFAGVFGVFNDSLPDGWGLLLMDRQFRSQGVDPRTLTPLDRLAYIGTRGMGALTYHPPAELAEVEHDLGIDLDALARQAERVLEGSTEEVLPALRIAGGSPGGARPKVLVGVRDDGRIISGTSALPARFRHFLVKFGAKEDPPDIGAVEAAYARMAESAGIAVPPTRLFETADGRYFGAERFDREGNRRVHMQTLGGLLHASHRVPSMEYEGFLRATLMLTRDQRQVEEAFRRMVFNVLAHNRDDHVKNFSYLMGQDGTWRLAPAYDLVFSYGMGGQHTMPVGGETARPTERGMLTVADVCDVDLPRARQIIEEVRASVQQWPVLARTMGVSAATRALIGERIQR